MENTGRRIPTSRENLPSPSPYNYTRVVKRKDKCEKWSVATDMKMKHQTKKLFIIKLHI